MVGRAHTLTRSIVAKLFETKCVCVSIKSAPKTIFAINVHNIPLFKSCSVYLVYVFLRAELGIPIRLYMGQSGFSNYVRGTSGWSGTSFGDKLGQYNDQPTNNYQVR